jgi:TolA-binding protein
MTAERPPRLKESAELGPLLRAAEPPATSPERLAANAAGVRQRIAAGVTTVAVWKIVVVLALVLAALVPLAWWLLHGERAPAAPGPIPTDKPEPATVIEPDAAEIDAGMAAVVEPDAAIAAVAPHVARGSASHHAAHVAPDAGTVAPVDAESASMSDLPEQIRIYEAARDASRRGDFDGALAQLDELMRRFPATQLRADAELTRADVLARSGRLAEAAQAFEALATDPAHLGRRGELLRTLGDLYRRLGDCPRALAAYTRAQAERLSDRDRAAVASGRARCE